MQKKRNVWIVHGVAIIASQLQIAHLALLDLHWVKAHVIQNVITLNIGIQLLKLNNS